MSATVTIDHTEHTYGCQWLPRSFREGGDKYIAECSCGWHGTPVAPGAEIVQWNQHVGTGER